MTEIESNKSSAALRKLLKLKNLTVREMADILGVHYRSMWQWQSVVRHARIPLRHAYTLYELFDINVFEFRPDLEKNIKKSKKTLEKYFI